jgi:tetratricopeptide (TPR) repeat protein
MRFPLLALLSCATACTPERAVAPDASSPPPPVELRLLGHRALRDEGGALVPVFDAASLPVVRVEGTVPAIELTPGAAAQVDAEVRGKWTFLRVRGPAPAPGAGELRAVVGGRVLRAWPVRWAVAPEKLPAIAPVAALRRAGKPQEALARLEAALPSMGPEARHWGLAERARLLWALDAGERATAAWVEAAEAARATGVPSEETRCLRAAAYTAYVRRRFVESRALLARAGPLEARLDDARGRARHDYYAGLLAWQLGDYREAATRLEGARHLAAEAGAMPDWAQASEMLADVEQEMGQHRTARALMSEIDQWAATRSSDDGWRARFQINRVWIEMRAMAEGAMTADWAALAKRLGEALALVRAQGDRPGEAVALVNLAEVCRRAGDLDGAARWLDAFDTLGSHAERYARLAAQHERAELRLARGERGAARAAFTAVLESSRREVEGEISEAAWRAWYGIGRAWRADGDAAKALAAFQRALEVLDIHGRRTGLRTARASFFADRRRLVEDTVALLLARGDVAGAFAAADASLSRAVRAIERPLRTSRLNATQAARWASLTAEYLERRDAWEALEREAALAAGRARGAMEGRAEAARLQAATAFDRAMEFLESAVPPSEGGDALGGVLGAGEALVEIVRMDDRLLGFWWQGERVEHAELDPSDPLAPWRSRLDGLAHLYIVDGTFGDVAVTGASAAVASAPIAARVATSHLPYAGLLRRAVTSAAGEPLVVADPGFDLPHARREGRDVAARLTGARLLTGAEATRGRVLELARDARLFHFAGHGVLDPDQPWDAHLRLAGDERLSLADVLVARPRLGVVVLSGCDTGRAAALSRVESVGLPAAFLVAGARAVVATEREVPDDQARRFIERFYAAGGAETPGTAFRQAVAETRAAGEPVWSAFRLFGRP